MCILLQFAAYVCMHHLSWILNNRILWNLVEGCSADSVCVRELLTYVDQNKWCIQQVLGMVNWVPLALNLRSSDPGALPKHLESPLSAQTFSMQSTQIGALEKPLCSFLFGSIWLHTNMMQLMNKGALEVKESPSRCGEYERFGRQEASCCHLQVHALGERIIAHYWERNQF